ncbi:MAG: chemotaxis protein CheA [Gammaproteobacteria bacterium]|nr:chemotaxis protein CheA [Gammaproteobacteria bacterium]
MSIDLSQFYEVFIEESFEGLDAMEAELLNLEPGDVDSEIINTIFRAAHSIKGGSGTFGFMAIADFTHVLETLLDQIRNGQRELESQHVDLLLKSVDCLRAMLVAIQNDEPQESELAVELKTQFQAILDGEQPTSPRIEESTEINDSSDTQSSSESQSVITIWQILFSPEPHLFKTGNEPLFLFEDLEDVGDITVRANLEKLPDLTHLSPEDSFIQWTITLETEGDVSEDKIKEVFEWVEDDAIIEISKKAQIEGLGDGIEEEAEPSTQQQTQLPTESPVEPETLDTAIIKDKPAGEAVKTTQVKSADKAEKPASTKSESGSIRVGTDKVDSLINMVGELVITQAMLNELGESDELDANKLAALREGLAQLSHNTRDLQESVMRIRMMPISFVFSRFPRLVRDISQKLDKQVELKLLGEQTELDKTVMEKISDPMVHLVRNSLDHGLETPDERAAAGKGKTGTVTLNAYHQGGNIVIEIIDDGRGLNTEKIKQKAIANGLIAETDDLSDDEINELIFQPGFSTADAVSDLSGRGVGMDVVKRNINALNGTVEVTSVPNVGSTFTIRLPLTLAILDGQLITVGKNVYIIPLVSIVESLQIDTRKVNTVGGGLEVLRLRDEYIPIMRLYDLFNHHDAQTELENGLLVVVESDNEKVGLLVDELLAQQQFVIKSLEANYKKVDGISGATILGDGSVSLIVDISGLIKLAGLKKAGKQGLDFDKPLSEAV